MEFTGGACFNGAGADGSNPTTGLILVSGGVLFGATQCGGAYGAGTIFELTPPARGQTQWTEKIIWSVNVAVKGINLFGLIPDANGDFWASTIPSSSTGCSGSIFELTPPAQGQSERTESMLVCGGADSGLTIDPSGNIYGISSSGQFNKGSVFMLAPKGKVITIYTFAGTSDGGAPYGVIWSGGALYGTTATSENGEYGDVFKLTPSVPQWDIDVLYTFTGTPGDGQTSFGDLIVDASGAVYGTSDLGGTKNIGTVYKVTP